MGECNGNTALQWEASKVVARIRALETQDPTITEPLKREVGYFQKHTHRMWYRTFNEKGYPIGSGGIASACKHVVAERCKQAGVRWSQTHINAIRFWRCLLKNETGILIGKHKTGTTQHKA